MQVRIARAEPVTPPEVVRVDIPIPEARELLAELELCDPRDDEMMGVLRTLLHIQLGRT